MTLERLTEPENLELLEYQSIQTILGATQSNDNDKNQEVINLDQKYKEKIDNMEE